MARELLPLTFVKILLSQFPRQKSVRVAAITAGAFALLLAGSSKLSLAGPTTALAPSIADIAKEYPSYREVTNGGVEANPELAILCVAPPPADMVEAARIKNGPHAQTWIRIYMNELAATAFPRKDGAYPVGAVIVKQKDHGKAGVGGMVKRAAGFDPSHGDWDYFYFENPVKIESGRINSCIQCHESARSTDYVFGTWRHPENP